MDRAAFCFGIKCLLFGRHLNVLAGLRGALVESLFVNLSLFLPVTPTLLISCGGSRRASQEGAACRPPASGATP